MLERMMNELNINDPTVCGVRRAWPVVLCRMDDADGGGSKAEGFENSTRGLWCRQPMQVTFDNIISAVALIIPLVTKWAPTDRDYPVEFQKARIRFKGCLGPVST